MANISSSTARVGYEIFRSSGCEASKAEINAALKKLGHPPISDRMHRHYRNLCAEGFNRYLSINRFDVARSSQPYEHLSASSRYKYVPSGSGARVTFPRGRRLVEGFGRVERAGETGLVLVFEDADTVKALSGRSRPRLGESVRVDVLDPARQFDARVVDHSEDSGRVVTEVEFERLQSIADITGRTPFALTRSEFRLVSMPEAEATVDLIGRQLFYLFEALSPLGP